MTALHKSLVTATATEASSIGIATWELMHCCFLSVIGMQMMRVEVTKYNKRFGIVKMAAKGYVGTDLAVEAELTLAMGKAS